MRLSPKREGKRGRRRERERGARRILRKNKITRKQEVMSARGGDEEQGQLGAVLVECITRVPAILLVAWHAGNVFQRYRLPRISGYLITGVLAGQHVLGLLTKVATNRLAMLDNLCLAVIGVAAGSELYLSDLRKNPKPALVMTASITVFTWVFIFAAFVVVGKQVEFISHLSSSHVYAVASLAATLGVARSPASAIAVLREVDGRGPFCSLVMSVTVVKDVLVVVMFAMNLEMVALSGLEFGRGEGAAPGGGVEIEGVGAADHRSLHVAKTDTSPHAAGVTAGGGGASGGALHTLMAFLHPIVSVAISFALGIASGLLIGQLLKPATRPALGRILRPTWILTLSAMLFAGSRTAGKGGAEKRVRISHAETHTRIYSGKDYSLFAVLNLTVVDEKITSLVSQPTTILGLRLWVCGYK